MFHYSDYYNIFNKENAIDYFLVKIDNESLAINSQKAYEEEKEKNELLSKKLLKVPSERNINKKMNSDKTLLCLKEDILLSNKYLANNEDNYIAGALVVKCKDKISIFSKFPFLFLNNPTDIFYIYLLIHLIYHSLHQSSIVLLKSNIYHSIL